MMTMKMIKKAITLTLGLVMIGAASFAQSLADAKKAIDAEQYQKATSMLKTLINSNAKEGENYFNLGNVYLLTDDIDSARAVYTNGVTASPKYALNYVGLGHADLKSKNPTSAKTNFDKALELGAKNYQTYLAIGKSYLEQEVPDYTAALPNLQKAEELDAKDKDPETFLALGDFYAMQIGKNSEAYPWYLRALDVNPNLTRAIVQIGRMYRQAYSFPDAADQIQKAIAIDANYGPAYRELAENDQQWSRAADVKDREAKRTSSLANMRKYLDLTDKSVDSRIRYAQFLVYANDYATLEKEVATLNVEASNPKSFLVTRLRGYSAVENKNFAAGVKYMNELFARKQDAARILGEDYLMLGRALQGTGNDSLAVMNITKAVEMDTTKVEELAAIGKKYYGERNYAKAAPIYKKVISLNSKNPAIAMNYYYFGVASYVVGANTSNREMLVEADSALAKVLSFAPETETALLNRARINKAIDVIDNKDTPKGLAAPFYEKLVTLLTVTKPEKAAANAKTLVDAYLNLGVYAIPTDREKAKEYFNKALAIEPTNTTALDNIKYLNAPAAPAKKAPIK
jgi:tetratricopeptide (TPR) repeat protein